MSTSQFILEVKSTIEFLMAVVQVFFFFFCLHFGSCKRDTTGYYLSRTGDHFQQRWRTWEHFQTCFWGDVGTFETVFVATKTRYFKPKRNLFLNTNRAFFVPKPNHLISTVLSQHKIQICTSNLKSVTKSNKALGCKSKTVTLKMLNRC